MTRLFPSLPMLLALSAAAVAADFTPYDFEYDGRAMLIDWTMYTVEQLVDEQKDDWLTKQFNTTNSAVQKSIKAGTVTVTEALQGLHDFYAVANTKYEGFDESAVSKIRTNSPDVSVVNIVAPESWCDYMFGLMYEVAKNSGSAELKTMLQTAQKKIEEAITKRIPPSEVNDLVVPLYGDGNKIYPTFSKELTAEIEKYASKYDQEVASAVIKKATVAPTTTTGGSTSATSTTPGSVTSAPTPSATSGTSMAVRAASTIVVLATTVAVFMA